MDATIIIAIVPVVLLVAYIIWLVRAKITEGRDIDLREPITGVVICLVAVLIIGSMTASAVSYNYSEETNTLYINQNIVGSSQPWDSYADDVKSVVIGNNCRLVETGTLDSLTNLEYVSIGENVDVRSGAFAVGFEDPFGQTIPYTDLPGSDYAGFGDGMMYQIDESIFSTNSSGRVSLAADKSTVINAVLPDKIGGTNVTALIQYAFSEGPLENFIALDNLQTIEYRAFYQCASLQKVRVPETLTTIAGGAFQETSIGSLSLPNITSLGNSTFGGCASLETITFEGLPATLGYSVFQDCTSLVSLTIPEGVVSTEGSTFSGCTSLATVVLPNSMTTLGYNAFNGCTGIEKVKFGTGLTTVSTSFPSWTFYASDGTTQLDKTVASNLAGKAFEGTAAALVEVSPGALTLSPEQIQMVRLHDAELQDLKDHISIDPLPFQPTAQTQDQEPVAA